MEAKHVEISKKTIARDTAIALSLGVTWYSLIQLRPSITTFHCATTPTACILANISLPFDRWVVGLASPTANFLSFATEYAGGLLALGTPWLVRRPSAHPIGSPRPSPFSHWLPLLHATLLNGVWMETCRNWVQRPRPFVYEAPLAYGKVASHYTSFYSGHTSFTAVAATLAWLTCRAHGATPRTQRAVALTGGLLVLLTGLFRVLAARHFVTDVLFGALAGTLAGLAVARTLHPSLTQSPESSST